VFLLFLIFISLLLHSLSAAGPSSWPMHQHDNQKSGRNPNMVTSKIFYDSSYPAPPECCSDYVEYNDVIYMSSNLIREQKGILFSMNRTSNTINWKFALNQANSLCYSWTYGIPVIDPDEKILYVTGTCITPFSILNTHPCVIAKISAQNGTLIDKEENLINGSCGDIILEHNRIWVQNDVDVNTTIIWAISKDLKRTLFHYVMKKEDRTSVVQTYTNGNDVVFVSYKNAIRAIYFNYTIAWIYSLPSMYNFIGGFASSNDMETLYTVTRNGNYTHLHAIHAKTGSELWVYPYKEKLYGDGLSPAIATDDMIYWTTGTELLALTPLGNLEWFYRSPKNNVNYVPPIISYNDIVILSFGYPGGIVGLNRFYGSVYWAYWDENPNYVFGTPYVDKNRRLWAWGTGILSTPQRYCYEEKGFDYPLCLRNPSELV